MRNLSVQIWQRAVYQSQQALLLDVICPYIVQMLPKIVWCGEAPHTPVFIMKEYKCQEKIKIKDLKSDSRKRSVNDFLPLLKLVEWLRVSIWEQCFGFCILQNCRQKSSDIVIPNGIPRIISQELFDRVQERRETNKKAPARHKAEEEYLLSTKLFCGKCKRMMAGESGKRRDEAVYRYYIRWSSRSITIREQRQ